MAFHEIIENIDIGGPSMVRSAAKNFEDVAIVTAASDYPALTEELEANNGALSRETRWRLARQAFALTAAYDSAIAKTLARRLASSRLRDKTGLPRPIAHQLSAGCPRCATARTRTRRPRSTAMAAAPGSPERKQLQGKELSYNNLVDLDACWDLAQEFTEPAGRHHQAHQPLRRGHRCDICSRRTPRRSRRDPVSAFGGVIGVNREIDEAAAEEIAKLFVEAIAAPGFTAEALARFAAKKNLRLVVVKPAARDARLQAGLRRAAAAGCGYRLGDGESI